MTTTWSPTYPNAELVLGIVCPLGTDHHAMVGILTDYLKHFGYHPNVVQLTESFPHLHRGFGLTWEPPDDPVQSARYKIQAGNTLRAKAGLNEFLALVAAHRISETRPGAGEDPQPVSRTVHIVATLKRPEEVQALRQIYGSGFFLLGIAPTRESEKDYFNRKNISEADSAKLKEIDREETEQGDKSPYGQRTRDTFHLADVFLSTENFAPEIERFLSLVFGHATLTPTRDEHAMFLAFAAALQSGDLARQIGAAIVDPEGDLLAIGCNEVPRPGGGHYGPEPGARRDIERGRDANDEVKTEIIQNLIDVLGLTDDLGTVRAKLKRTGLTDITEFGRSVHAEMQALLACARTGRSTRGAAVYTTTWPCHNCCRHIIAAGIKKVVYVEPYPKSRAEQLHYDAIAVDVPEPDVKNRVLWVRFLGIGPRRYFDLFSLNLSSGYPVERKNKNGDLLPFQKPTATLRHHLQPASYLDTELLAVNHLDQIMSNNGSRPDEAKPARQGL